MGFSIENRLRRLQGLPLRRRRQLLGHFDLQGQRLACHPRLTREKRILGLQNILQRSDLRALLSDPETAPEADEASRKIHRLLRWLHGDRPVDRASRHPALDRSFGTREFMRRTLIGFVSGCLRRPLIETILLGEPEKLPDGSVRAFCGLRSRAFENGFLVGNLFVPFVNQQLEAFAKRFPNAPLPRLGYPLFIGMGPHAFRNIREEEDLWFLGIHWLPYMKLPATEETQKRIWDHEARLAKELCVRARQAIQTDLRPYPAGRQITNSPHVILLDQILREFDLQPSLRNPSEINTTLAIGNWGLKIFLAGLRNPYGDVEIFPRGMEMDKSLDQRIAMEIAGGKVTSFFIGHDVVQSIAELIAELSALPPFPFQHDFLTLLRQVEHNQQEQVF